MIGRRRRSPLLLWCPAVTDVVASFTLLGSIRRRRRAGSFEPVTATQHVGSKQLVVDDTSNIRQQQLTRTYADARFSITVR